jgi:hypothetical protein
VEPGGDRKSYYDMLERSNKHNEITDWLLYFAETILASLAESQGWVEFLIEKKAAEGHKVLAGDPWRG